MRYPRGGKQGCKKGQERDKKGRVGSLWTNDWEMTTEEAKNA